MPKPDWKTKPHERNRMTLQQENQKLKARVDVLVYELDAYKREAAHYRELYDQHLEEALRYRLLRTKDVMVLDGEPKYLKEKDLDEYCDVEKNKWWGISMMAGINHAFNSSVFKSKPTNLIVPASVREQANKIVKEYKNGNDAGSKSEEADQKDSGHHTDILRYADRYRLWK